MREDVAVKRYRALAHVRRAVVDLGRDLVDNEDGAAVRVCEMLQVA